MKINSKEYWDERFKSNDWILAGGDNQNKYFYNLMLELIPETIKDEIHNNFMSICDFGCAEGDGLEIFKKTFISSDITGVDISESALTNARKKYFNINFTTKVDKEYDLIISSNTFEHFSEPHQILEDLFNYSRKYIILLLPFKEYPRIDEHLYTFDFDNIQMKYKDFKLLYINWVDSDKMYWNGKQIILIYMKNADEKEINKNFFNTLSLKSNFIDNLDTEICSYIIKIEEKQSELMKISDWAKQLKEQIKVLEEMLIAKDSIIEEKQSELMEISDWANQLNVRLNKIDNNFLLRNLEKVINKEVSMKQIFYKIGKKTAKKFLPNFILNKIKQKINYKKTISLVVSNAQEMSINKRFDFTQEEVLYVFPVIDWLFRIQRPQQIAKGFLNSGYKIVYFKTIFLVVNEPGYAYEVIEDKIINVTLFLNEQKNIYKDKLDNVNIEFLLRGISKLERDFSINKRISIIDHPFWFPLSKKLSGNFSIYDCMDYHPGFGDESAYLVELEEIAMTQSDLLVLTSNDLYERFSTKNKNSILVRNGCEFEFFNKKPENIYKSKYEKIVGYYGAISSWFDTEMVISLAKYFPNYEFLLVGSTHGCEKLNELEKIKNVTLLGEVEYSKLTEYLYSFDVAIMPFKINELTIATNPVKVYEYLSSGVSVVSTKLPEIEFMGDVVYSAISFDEFVTQINVALEKDTEQILNKRIDFAKNNDWNERFTQIENKVVEINQNKPKISIILVTYNNLDFTKACLDSMEKFNNYTNCEIIVVDNLSQDGTREYLTEYERNHSNFKAILHDCNSGFAAGNNIGINESTGEYVILLNNDTVVTPNWIENLIKHFKLDNNIGMVGPRTNNIGNESRLDINYTNTEEMIEKSYNIYYENVDKQYNIPILAFFCVAIKREIIEKIGLLDEAYGIGMFEDDDYCMRAREQGHKLICADDVFIHHHLGASFDKNPEWKEQLFKKNKAIYESKWGKWEGHSYR